MAETEATATMESSSSPGQNVASNNGANSSEANVQGKQEEPATLSTLNEKELKELLDEAITYKCPKDREGKSNLFKELLQEAEADETEDSRSWTVTNSRCLPGSNRRRHKRDNVSERLTHGGSLQNLAQSINSEFDSSFAYLTSANNSVYGGSGRRKISKKLANIPTSVSARQREGGSLPSNVNASHTSSANFDLGLNKRTTFLEEKSIQREWGSNRNQERHNKKAEDKFFHNNSNTSSTCDAGDAINGGTNEMLDSDNPPPDYEKQDCMVIDLEDIESSVINDRNASAALGGVQRPSLDADNEEEGTEMKTIENRRPPVHFVTRATFDIPQIPVDSPLDLPTFRDHHHSSKLDSKSKISVNGTEGTNVGSGSGTTLPFPPYSSYSNVKCVMSSSPPSLYSVVPWPPNLSMGTLISRITAQHIAGGKDALTASASTEGGASNSASGANKDSSNNNNGGANGANSGGSGDKSGKKTLDENGNAVQGGHSGDRKKSRRKNEQKEIVYQAKDVKGHRYEADIELLVNFIENKDNKAGKKGGSGNKAAGSGGTGGSGVAGGGASVVSGSASGSAVNSGSKVHKTSANSKSRSRDNKDVKRKEISAKLQKSNSLEEISKISKLEDLTTEKETLSSSSSTASSQNGPANVALRRVKQRSIGDAVAEDSRGDRRSWGTEEGQSIYCNDTGDDYNNGAGANGSAGRQRNVAKKNILENEAETEFHVVMNKKKKTKKQRRRSSSGGRAQNSSANAGYLQRGRGFSSEYRATLSPELRRKSASSMPPSDKSDSSDIDSVHSLPVTSNSKNANANSAPQASYAEIARMASMQTATAVVPTPNPTPNTANSGNPSNIIPNINTSTWPSVSSSSSSKNNGSGSSESEQQKWQNSDYYPSLDELQQGSSDHRKTRANNSQHQQVTSPTLASSVKPKPGNSPADNISTKKPLPPKEVEDHISQISTKQLVQDVDKVRQGGDHWHRQRETASSKNSSNTSSPNANEGAGTAAGGTGALAPPKSSDSSMNVSSSHESGNNSDDSSKHSSANSKSSSMAGASYAKRATMVPTTAHHQQQQQNTGPHVPDENPKSKRGNTAAAAGPQLVESSDECSRFSSPAAESSDYSARYNKAERYVKNSSKSQTYDKKDQPTKASNYQQVPPTYRSNKKYWRGDKDTRVSETPQQPHQHQQQAHESPSSNSISRPAVILLDEKVDQFNSVDSSGGFTFGFDVNEQLLQSEEAAAAHDEDEENPVTSPEPSRSSTSTPNFGKPPPNIQVHPPFASGQVVVSTTTQASYVGFTGSYPLPQGEKRRSSSAGSSSVASAGGNQQKEDFSARFVAPDDVDVQHYNHDKIVSFVGSAWDELMQEMPSSASGNGKIRYYSEQ